MFVCEHNESMNVHVECSTKEMFFSLHAAVYCLQIYKLQMYSTITCFNMIEHFLVSSPTTCGISRPPLPLSPPDLNPRT